MKTDVLAESCLRGGRGLQWRSNREGLLTASGGARFSG